ncbi:MAG: CPBP family glutamic-type intramembrane protease [Hyphomonas sp.]|uniref:CPBP family glutamic-type intramembrane protease n=1 Tax=Hyphomonas sp. TaxID=87 RepID=UPI0035271925
MQLLGWRNTSTDIKRPIVWAVLGFFVYFAGVVIGDIAQGVLAPPLSLGWGQQIFGALFVFGFAKLIGRSTGILALKEPTGLWPFWMVLVVILIVGASQLAGGMLGLSPEAHGVEYFAYQATMPGLSEELGFRGLLLGLLFCALRRHTQAGWAALLAVVLAALPFGALHLFEYSGREFLIVFTFTAFAGILLGGLRLVSGSLWPSILAHNVANVLIGVVDMVLLSG